MHTTPDSCDCTLYMYSYCSARIPIQCISVSVNEEPEHTDAEADADDAVTDTLATRCVRDSGNLSSLLADSGSDSD